MTSLFATGRIVDLILAFTAIEAILVVIYHRRTGRGVAPAEFLGNLLSGVWLMLALRGALVGVDRAVLGRVARRPLGRPPPSLAAPASWVGGAAYRLTNGKVTAIAQANTSAFAEAPTKGS
jgi:hypothetical protein